MGTSNERNGMVKKMRSKGSSTSRAAEKCCSLFYFQHTTRTPRCRAHTMPRPPRRLIKVRRVLTGICARRGKPFPAHSQAALLQRYTDTLTERCRVCLQGHTGKYFGLHLFVFPTCEVGIFGVTSGRVRSPRVNACRASGSAEQGGSLKSRKMS